LTDNKLLIFWRNLVLSASRYCKRVGSVEEIVALNREKVDYATAIPNQKKKGCCAVGRTMGRMARKGEHKMIRWKEKC
jgi:hypothetical protein